MKVWRRKVNPESYELVGTDSPDAATLARIDLVAHDGGPNAFSNRIVCHCGWTQDHVGRSEAVRAWKEHHRTMHMTL